jgi:L-asparagine transporter-like permease
MFKNLFRKKSISKILSDHESGLVDDIHGGSLHRTLTTRDLTFFGIAAIIGAGSFSSLGNACFDGGPGIILLFMICLYLCLCFFR